MPLLWAGRCLPQVQPGEQGFEGIIRWYLAKCFATDYGAVSAAEAAHDFTIPPGFTNGEAARE